MSDTKKPRADSVLKTLPEERQEAIADYLRSHSLAETRDWLKGDGLKTSLTGLSEFFSWYQLRKQFSAFSSNAEEMVALLRQDRPELSEAKLQEYANSFFQLQALQTQNLGHYVKLSSARHRATMSEKNYQLKKAELELNVAKFQRETCELFLSWYADQRAKDIAGASLGNAEKIEALGQLMFGDLWKAK